MSLAKHIKRSKQWIKRQRKRLRCAHDQHRFGPLKQLSPIDPGSRTFHPQDQLFTYLLFQHIKPTFNHILDIDGKLHQPTRDIPIRATLSPFFGALYLTPLDRAFENLPGVFYVRFMDDALILTKTYKQFKKARKKIYKILRALKLTLSPSKSTYGALAKKPFHYLGFQFNGTRTSSNPRKPVSVSLHARTHQRARDRIQDQDQLGVDPQHCLNYLERWCRRSKLKELLTTSDIACAWREYIYAQDPIPMVCLSMSIQSGQSTRKVLWKK